MSKIIYYNGDYKPLAQKLRREMTRQEKHLWYDFLKTCKPGFKRQKQFGHYIVDFYCADAGLVVEIDGSQHYEPDARQEDEAREQYLKSLGLSILRFSNHDVSTCFESVCATIYRQMNESK